MLDTILHAPQGWLLTTIAIYAFANFVQRLGRGSPLLNPLLLTICAIAVLLDATGTSYQRYQASVAILDFLLGTAIVALGVPLHGLLVRFGAGAISILPALVIGSVCGTELAIEMTHLLGGSPMAVSTIAPQTATAAIAAEISGLTGGVPSATAVVCIASGIIGAVFGPYVLRMVGADSARARGIAYGTASHGVGTSRAFGESEETGAWSTLAMCVNGALAALLVPALLAAWSLR